jgi:hypothetical protein
MNAHDEEPDD